MHGLSKTGEDEIDKTSNDLRIEESGSLARGETCSLVVSFDDVVDFGTGYWSRLLVEGVVSVLAREERAFGVLLTYLRVVLDRACLDREDTEVRTDGFIMRGLRTINEIRVGKICPNVEI